MQTNRGLDALKQVLEHDASYWESLSERVLRKEAHLLPDDEKALTLARQMPGMLPTDGQVVKLLQPVDPAEDAGWQVS
jgi:hypothetical protein